MKLNNMFRLERLPNILEYLLIQSEDGVIETLYNTLQQKQIIDELTCYLTDMYKMNVLKKIFVIVEYLLQNKEMILKDKSILWLTNSQDIQLLKTLDLDLTLKGKDCYPFWNNVRKDLYNLLPLPQKIDCVDLDSSYLNGFSNKKTYNSWFYTKKTLLQNKNSLEISYPLCRFSMLDGMEKDDIKLSMKCRKIKLKVPHQVKLLWKKWSDLYRFTYNRSVWFQNESDSILSNYELINCIKSNHHYGFYPFIHELPTELREGSAKEVSKSLNTCFTQLKNDVIHKFKLKYKSKHNKSWTLTNFQKRSLKYVTKSIDKNGNKMVDLRNFQILPSYCPHVIHSYQKLPEEISNDFSIHYDGYDYYLLLPFENKLVNRFNTNTTISIDPGVRTFATTYNNKGDTEEICISKSSGYLHSLALQLDKYISKRTKCNRKKRLIYSKRIIQIRKKLKNLQKELHNKVANKLTKENDNIIIPSFKVKEMSRRFKNRKITTKTVRNMSLLGHTLFKTKLKTKALERGSRILICEEHYTSKTCTGCGEINNNLYSSKVFKCKKCLLIIDRDVNAARNIMLRAMRGSAISDSEIKDILLFKNNILEEMKQNH